MDIVNYNSFIVISDLDVLADLVDHSAAPADHLVGLFDHLVVQFDHLGCNSGPLDDYFELVGGDSVVVAALIDLADLLAVRFDLPDYMIVLVDRLADLSDLVDYFASLYYAIFSNDFARTEWVVAAVDVFAVRVGPVVGAVDDMADLNGFHYKC